MLPHLELSQLFPVRAAALVYAWLASGPQCHCFRASTAEPEPLTAWLAEFEDTSRELDDFLPVISVLLALAARPKRDGLGGLLPYLVEKLSERRSRDACVAMRRLHMGWEAGAQVCIRSCSTWPWACPSSNSSACK